MVHKTSQEEKCVHVSLVYNKLIKAIFILVNFSYSVSIANEPWCSKERQPVDENSHLGAESNPIRKKFFFIIWNLPTKGCRNRTLISVGLSSE